MTDPLRTRALVRRRVHRLERRDGIVETPEPCVHCGADVHAATGDPICLECATPTYPVDTPDCPHPLRSLRYDGRQEMADGTYMASVTCMEPDCLTSKLIPIREDEQARLQNGGARGRHGSDGSGVFMDSKKGA